MPESETGGTSSEANKAIIRRLAYAPQRILNAVSGWSEAQIHGAPAESEWSAADILAHLRASDDIVAYRIYAILARDVPPLPAYDERRWAEVAGYAQMEFRASLDTFTKRRAEIVALLRRITPEDWERSGTHEVRGTLTLRAVVAGLVEYEEEHAGQIEALRAHWRAKNGDIDILNLTWEDALRVRKRAGYQVLRLDGAPVDDVMSALKEHDAPDAVRVFAQGWMQPERDPWRALVESAAVVNPEVWAELGADALLAPVRILLQRAEYAAITWGRPCFWTSTVQWTYLLQFSTKDEQATVEHMILYPPATSDDIFKAEAVVNMKISPTYRRFLQITNGMDIGAMIAVAFVNGAGPSRADWKAVVNTDYAKCESSREIAAYWRTFQAIYDGERIWDREHGENTFLSDETVLVPFAHSTDDWCFDRAQRHANGEYAIMFWDHEMREASHEYDDFATWFERVFVTYLDGEL